MSYTDSSADLCNTDDAYLYLHLQIKTELDKADF